MSAIVGLFDGSGRTQRCQAPDDPAGLGALARDLVGQMAVRGAERVGVWRHEAAALAVGRYAWELAADQAGPVLVVRDGELAVAADASLYYRDALRRALGARGVRPTGPTSAHLILAAYRAWGVRLAEYLEGDFAFVLYDRLAGRALAARDFVGSRPLHWAELGDGTLVVASTLGGVAAHPRFDDTLDLAEVALEAAGLGFTMTTRTAYANARRLDPGHTLVRERGRRAAVTSHWQVPPPSGQVSSFADGAAELRGLLADAVRERLAAEAPTSVWLSGGCDSTAVFAAGHLATDTHALLPVSLRFPADDPGCENHLIAQVAQRWSRPVHWIDSTQVPLVDAPDAAAAARDGPWAPDYQQISLALCAGTQAVGARVALNGHGGDLLFMSSPVILADHLRRLELASLWREWHAVLGGRPRELFRWAVQPLLPDSALRLARTARGGRRLHGYFERVFPKWFRPEFQRAHDLDARVASGSPRARGGSRSAHELAWLATHPQLGLLTSDHQTNALAHGADSRSPLMDGRIVAFAASRPASERRQLREGKRLLRHAMRGLLPDSVLAPRPVKTGTLAYYAARAFADTLPSLHAICDDPLLAQYGIVDVDRLRWAVDWVSGGRGDLFMRSGLLATLHAELWLRARTRSPVARLAQSRPVLVTAG